MYYKWDLGGIPFDSWPLASSQVARKFGPPSPEANIWISTEQFGNILTN
jgi:hypothetical protein